MIFLITLSAWGLELILDADLLDFAISATLTVVKDTNYDPTPLALERATYIIDSIPMAHRIRA